MRKLGLDDEAIVELMAVVDLFSTAEHKQSRRVRLTEQAPHGELPGGVAPAAGRAAGGKRL